MTHTPRPRAEAHRVDPAAGCLPELSDERSLIGVEPLSGKTFAVRLAVLAAACAARPTPTRKW